MSVQHKRDWTKVDKTSSMPKKDIAQTYTCSCNTHTQVKTSANISSEIDELHRRHTGSKSWSGQDKRISAAVVLLFNFSGAAACSSVSTERNTSLGQTQNH